MYIYIYIYIYIYFYIYIYIHTYIYIYMSVVQTGAICPPRLGTERLQPPTKGILSWESPHERNPLVGSSPRKVSLRGSLLTKGFLSWKARIDSSRGSSHEKNLFVGGPTNSFLSWDPPREESVRGASHEPDSSRGSPREESLPRGVVASILCYFVRVPPASTEGVPDPSR